MSDDNLISIVRNFAVENSEKNDIHGFAHVERVYHTCVKVGKKLNANLKVLQIAALLHDVGKVILDQFLHDEMIKVLQLVKEQEICFHEAENEVHFCRLCVTLDRHK